MPTEIQAEVRDSTDTQQTTPPVKPESLLDLLKKHIKEYFYFYDSPRGLVTEVAK